MSRAGQNRIYTPYSIVYLAISLSEIPYIDRMYAWVWPTLDMSIDIKQMQGSTDRFRSRDEQLRGSAISNVSGACIKQLRGSAISRVYGACTKQLRGSSISNVSGACINQLRGSAVSNASGACINVGPLQMTLYDYLKKEEAGAFQ